MPKDHRSGGTEVTHINIGMACLDNFPIELWLCRNPEEKVIGTDLRSFKPYIF